MTTATQTKKLNSFQMLYTKGDTYNVLDTFKTTMDGRFDFGEFEPDAEIRVSGTYEVIGDKKPVEVPVPKAEGNKEQMRYSTFHCYYDMDDPASILKTVRKFLSKQEGLSEEAVRRVTKAQVAITEWEKYTGQLNIV